MKHVAKRFLLHFFSAGPIWLAVYFLAALPISKWGQEPNLLATSLMMLVIAIREIFDANKLAKIRGKLLSTIFTKIVRNEEMNPVFLKPINDTLNDPRYTLRKSLIDLSSWALGISTAIWLMSLL